MIWSFRTQPSLLLINEPTIQVWENVTFADNYYQDLANPNGSTLTPNGRRLDDADLNIHLNGREGFKKDNPFAPFNSPHGRVLTWYSGTLDLELSEVKESYLGASQAIYDQLGERSVQDLLDLTSGNVATLSPWYSFGPSQTTEGIGTGWAYSILGGGQRPASNLTHRVPVNFDNTDEDIAEGDFAVPTVFNGNFDVGLNDDPNAPVPGWSFHNGNQPLLRKYLVDVSTIPTLVEKATNNQLSLAATTSTASQLENQKNFAVKLGDGNPTGYIHNPEIVPDWGVLRFDLHVPVPDLATAPQNSVVRVFLDDYELLSSAYQGLSIKERQSNGNPNVNADEYPAVDLRAFNPTSATSAGLNPKLAEAQSNRIGFAKDGFQTFQVDIPNEFRGKVKTLRFEVSGGKIVYLDNVFFKSQHLLFGNPVLNGQEARKDIDTPHFSDPYFIQNNQEPYSEFRTNYLIEKPQYSFSYNDDTRTPNWVSYQLNKSWLGNYNENPKSFQPDPRLPFGT